MSTLDMTGEVPSEEVSSDEPNITTIVEDVPDESTDAEPEPDVESDAEPDVESDVESDVEP